VVFFIYPLSLGMWDWMPEENSEKLGLNASWSMAVGGMIGGGIFSVLGVVILISGGWAWLSFAIAGIIALATAHSYSLLAEKYPERGGAFVYLRRSNHMEMAGNLSWLLIVGYILTISVYAFTFGHYLAYSIGLEGWFPRFAALAIVAVLTGVNLMGVSESADLQIVTVWGKVIILLVLAALGLMLWNPPMLSEGIQDQGMEMALVGAASVFMAYEGFQLLAYDYQVMKNPKRTFPISIMLAVLVVAVIYILVTLGATMLVGPQAIIDNKEVALSIAGQKALGNWGLLLATTAALFSTASAINATLFATARLAQKVSEEGELPSSLKKRDKRGLPRRSIVLIGAGGAVLSVSGSLSGLVESASLLFLFLFSVVNILAFMESKKRRLISLIGAGGAMSAAALLLWRFATTAPELLFLLALMIAGTIVGRRFVKKRGGCHR